MACHNLIMDPEARAKYDYSTHRKGEALKVRPGVAGKWDATGRGFSILRTLFDRLLAC